MFKDMLDAVEQLGKGIKALTDLPEKDRNRYREVIGETYSLLDSALTMVINRLGDISHIEKDQEFLQSVRELDNLAEWTQLERDVRLCSNLRTAGREMSILWNKLKGRVTLRNQDDFFRLVYHCLEQGEGKLADHINSSLEQLSAAGAAATPEVVKELRGDVISIRRVLQEERRLLIEKELSLYSSI